jgi:hypothetical protein
MEYRWPMAQPIANGRLGHGPHRARAKELPDLDMNFSCWLFFSSSFFVGAFHK